MSNIAIDTKSLSLRNRLLMAECFVLLLLQDHWFEE